MAAEELNEALLEGESVNNWSPGAWTNAAPLGEEEYQPDMEPPHVNDYAAFKKHKHYRQYFRPYRYLPFPAWVYHETLQPKLIEIRGKDGRIDPEACAAAVTKLGPGWRREPYPRHQAQSNNMTGKTLPVKSQTEQLGEIVARSIAARPSSASIDANAIAAVVAAVMAAMNGGQSAAQAAEPAAEPIVREDLSHGKDDIERKALLELAEKEGIRIDRRWSSERIKKELGLG